MTTTTPPLPDAEWKSNATRAILWAGSVCGILDICAAFAAAGARGTSPIRVLQSIAAALLGRHAYAGGMSSAALGLAMHACVAFAVAAIFYALSRRFYPLLRWPVTAGLAYGAAVYVAMYWAVIPLAAVLRGFYQPDTTVRFPPFSAQALVIHLFFVGLPVAFTVRRFATSTPAR